MNSSSDYEDLTTEELKVKAHKMLELASQREAEEAARREEQLKSLEEEREQLLNKLDDLNQKIADLGGNSVGFQFKGSTHDATTISDAIVEFVANRKVVSSKELKCHIESLGMNPDNLGQIVAYLKRQGRLDSAGRGQYCLPDIQSSD